MRHRQAVPAALRCTLTMNWSKEYRSLSRLPRVLVLVMGVTALAMG